MILPAVRFLHTADWQLGMRRHYLGEDALPRFQQARIDAIRSLGRLAQRERCSFLVVAGDVFESNQIDRVTLRRSVEALREIELPVYLLPGNHDPLDAGTIFRRENFTDAPNVHLLT
ncbi:MAG: metallophosphoesterase family protein, partial [Planctomycetota bacterium]